MSANIETDEQKVRNLLNTGVEEPMLTTLVDLSTPELKMRLGVVTSVLREAQADKDPRWKNLIPQQSRLNAALVARLKGEREIAPTVINMQAASLAAKAKSF